jgi:phosphate transport system substrate-binding protein
MAELVKKTPNSIGYVELNYAKELNLAYGSVMNAKGKFQAANLVALGVAVEAAQDLKSDFRVSIVNAPGEGAYPICTLTWIVVPGQMGDPAKQKAMKEFLRWGYAKGQKLAMPMDYGVLQPPLLDSVRDQVADIR